ncbi:MAG: HIRAN domain-containing protein [Bryobacteraceae bacterium]
MTHTLFLAWQDPQRRQWYPIGRLSSTGGLFRFVYTHGALIAEQKGRFAPLAAFPDLRAVYQSDELFPLFANRLMRASRPDYPLLLKWLDIPEADAMPFTVLVRSGGQRVTDTLEVFPYPEKLPDDSYQICFFLHGLSHMPPESARRAEGLTAGERLLILRDFQNPDDPDALLLRTSEKYPRDMHLVGYCPRFLSNEIGRLMASGNNPPCVTVERVNPPPAPIQFRILCRLRMKWTPGFQPFDSTEYQPLVRAEENQLQVA